MINLIKDKGLLLACLLSSIVLLSGCHLLGDAIQIDKVLTVRTGENIRINMEVGDVHVGVSPDEKVHLTYYEYKYIKFSLMQNNGFSITQDIKEELLYSPSSGNIEGMTILVPATITLDTFDTTINVGDIRVQELKANNFDIDTDVGDIKFNKLIADNVTIHSNVGDIKLTELNANNITIDVSVGDVSGSILGNRNEFNIKTDVNVGDNNLGNGSGGSGGSKNLDVKVDVGDINISFKQN